MIPIHPAPFLKCSGLIVLYVDYYMSNVQHCFVRCFGSVPTRKQYFYLCRAPILASPWYTPE